jgi:N-acetylglucosamine-6-phosphate deacetylase
MNDGEIVARLYTTQQPIRMGWRAGVITHLETSASAPAPDVWIAPPLFDLQINGFAGVDFQQDNLSMDALVHATRRLRASGCARYLLTLITDDWRALMERLRHLRALRAQSAELQSAIAGWHVEGPFLSAEPGFHGTHDPQSMRDPTPEHILELRTLTGNDPLLLTLAPERSGALEAIALAVARGIKVSLGHTDAPVETLRQAVQAGATGFTHLGNGCPAKLDRHDNILWRIFEMAGLTVGLIPDQIHVSPPFFRLAHRVLASSAIYYTTDAMAAAGAPPGRYKISRIEVEVGPDRVVRQPGRTNLAGSAVQPMDAVFRAAEMLRCGWQDVWARFSETPAKFMGLRNELAVQQPADFCLLQFDRENRLADLQVHLNGAKALSA